MLLHVLKGELQEPRRKRKLCLTLLKIRSDSPNMKKAILHLLIQEDDKYSLSKLKQNYKLPIEEENKNEFSDSKYDFAFVYKSKAQHISSKRMINMSILGDA